MQTNSIAILMATYNGEKYLREQIDSLFAQTSQDWHLYVHDDGSKDNTVSIVKQYIERYPQKVTLMDYPSQGGACKNFLSMLEMVEAPYYMFCDQDDVWLPEKIVVTFAKLKELEKDLTNTPIIVHSDLCITDSESKEIAPSFVRNQQIKIEKIKHFADYASTNTVTGCTMIFNNEAKRYMKRPFDKAQMHDAWLCLSVSVANGVVYFIDKPTVKYRQHESNVLGAVNIDKMTLFYKLKNILYIIKENEKRYKEMKAVSYISVIEFLLAKIKYKL